MSIKQEKTLKRAPTLTDEVSRMLGEAIRSGQYKPGERLPTETALCEAYGVSRPVIREAISQLKFDGLVVPQQGRGVFVSEGGFKSTLRFAVPNFANRIEVLKIIELLLAVEVYYTGLAAKHRTERQLSRIRNSLEKLVKAISSDEVGSEEDLNFHMEIVNASHNQFFVALASFLKENFRYAIKTARANSSKFLTLNKEVLREHEAIFRAIEEQDVEKARQAAETHLKNAAVRLTRQIPENFTGPTP